MWSARAVRSAFFPLDEELGLLAGQQFTPLLCESMARLGSWLPFAQAADALSYFRQTSVSASTIRRVTEAAGAARVAHEEQQRTQSGGAAASTMTLQLLTLDGAFVPLVGGEWKEVKTLTLGEVCEPVLKRGEMVVHTQALSYFSRLADVEDFRQQAQVETQRRGTAHAQTVCAVSDGATWIQGVVEEWRSDAVRILDVPHALGYVAQAGQALYGLDTPAFASWFRAQREILLHGQPQRVVDALQHLSLEAEAQTLPEIAQTLIHDSWAYLRKRLPMVQYAAFQALGYPIGSGAGESANKVIVERRLKGAGMRWLESHVNSLLALTNLTANGRWRSDWPKLIAFRSHQAWQARLARRPATVVPESVDPLPPTPETPLPAKTPYRPDEKHPWRRAPLGRRRSSAA